MKNSDENARNSTGNRYQDVVTYTCIPGYEIAAGSATIQCQANKLWSAPPTCISKLVSPNTATNAMAVAICSCISL